MQADDLRRYLEFYQDLGVKELYRRDQGPGIRGQGPGSGDQGEATAMALVPAPEAPAPEGGSVLLPILQDIGDCRRCRLHEGRTHIVFGVGNEQAQLVFVGEGPGADEDAQGIPFVGRAGQLLTQMIEGTAQARRNSAAA